mgnify:CR=1 FL=1
MARVAGSRQHPSAKSARSRSSLIAAACCLACNRPDGSALPEVTVAAIGGATSSQAVAVWVMHPVSALRCGTVAPKWNENAARLPAGRAYVMLTEQPTPSQRNGLALRRIRPAGVVVGRVHTPGFVYLVVRGAVRDSLELGELALPTTLLAVVQRFDRQIGLMASVSADPTAAHTAMP